MLRGAQMNLPFAKARADCQPEAQAIKNPGPITHVPRVRRGATGVCGTDARGRSTNVQQSRMAADRVVAELRFGFWCGMFNGAYEDAGGPWPRLLSVVFPRVPKTWRTRPKVRRRIEEARLVRNRIFHHEPIAHLADLADRHRRLIELLGWLSPEARRHVEHLCRFQPVFSDALTLLR